MAYADFTLEGVEATCDLTGPPAVTAGEIWQLLRLEGSAATIDRTRLFIDNVSGILAVLRAVVGGV